MSENQGQRTITTLADFGRREWFSSVDDSSFWLQIYTCFNVTKDESAEKFKKTIRQFEYHLPVAITYGWMKELELGKLRHTLTSLENGALDLQIHDYKLKLPTSLYAFVATPCSIDGAKPNFEKIHKTYNVVTSLLRAYVGHNLLREKVFDRQVMARDGSTPHGERYTLMKFPQPGDGPFFMDFVWNGAKAAIDSLKVADKDTQRRVELALEYLSKGFAADRGFVEYWTACEILCEGKRAPEMRKRLQSYYGFPDRKDVDRILRLKTLEVWRHNLLHRGIYPDFKPQVERYLQMMFLDLLRSELGLEGPGYMLSFLHSPGYDLTDLGIERAPGPRSLLPTEGNDRH